MSMESTCEGRLVDAMERGEDVGRLALFDRCSAVTRGVQEKSIRTLGVAFAVPPSDGFGFMVEDIGPRLDVVELLTSVQDMLRIITSSSIII